MSTQKSQIRCETPKCVEIIAKHGELYHRVHDRTDYSGYPNDFVARCESCGGLRREDGTWEHRCSKCKSTVSPGALVGMFVPSMCQSCSNAVVAADKAAGRVCRQCNTVFSYCCC